MNENQIATDLVLQCESKAQADTVRAKLSLVRTAEDVVERLPRSRRELFEAMLASIETQIRMCESYLSNADNYSAYRRQLANEECVHRRMREHHETREMARLVLAEIAAIERERMRVLLSALSAEQTRAIARSAAERQVELDNQPRYQRVAAGVETTTVHLNELRALRVHLLALLGKGK